MFPPIIDNVIPSTCKLLIPRNVSSYDAKKTPIIILICSQLKKNPTTKCCNNSEN